MSVLLRQPHGFECLFSRSEPDRSHDESISHGPDTEYPLFEPCTAAPASTNDSWAHDDLLVVIDDLIDLDPVVLQLPEELLERPEKTGVAMVDLRIRKVKKIVPFDVRSKPREGGFRVAAVERFSNAPRDLHVLLRHRPRSIPQAQESA